MFRQTPRSTRAYNRLTVTTPCRSPTPPSMVGESREHARGGMLRETMAVRSLVVKPLFGSQGIGVRRLERGTAFPVPMEEHVDSVYYLQRYVDMGEGAWHDYRVFVINDKVAAAMVRHGNQWINNVAQGDRKSTRLNSSH